MIEDVQEENLIVQKVVMEFGDQYPMEMELNVFINDGEIKKGEERVFGASVRIFCDQENAKETSNDASLTYREMHIFTGMPHPYETPLVLVSNYDFKGDVPEEAKGIMYIRALRSAINDAFSLGDYVNIAMYIHKKDMPAIEEYFRTENIAEVLGAAKVFVERSSAKMHEDWCMLAIRAARYKYEEIETDDPELFGDQTMRLMS